MDKETRRLPFENHQTGLSVMLKFAGGLLLVAGCISAFSLVPKNTYDDQGSLPLAFAVFAGAIVFSSILFGLAEILINLTVLRLIASGAVDATASDANTAEESGSLPSDAA